MKAFCVVFSIALCACGSEEWRPVRHAPPPRRASPAPPRPPPPVAVAPQPVAAAPSPPAPVAPQPAPIPVEYDDFDHVSSVTFRLDRIENLLTDPSPGAAYGRHSDISVKIQARDGLAAVTFKLEASESERWSYHESSPTSDRTVTVFKRKFHNICEGSPTAQQVRLLVDGEEIFWSSFEGHYETKTLPDGFNYEYIKDYGYVTHEPGSLSSLRPEDFRRLAAANVVKLRMCTVTFQLADREMDAIRRLMSAAYNRF